MTLELLWWWFCFFELVRSSLFLRSAFVCCTSVTPLPRCSWQSESWCQVLSTDRCERSESHRQLYGNGARGEHFASCQHYPSCGNRSTQSHCMLSGSSWTFNAFDILATMYFFFQTLSAFSRQGPALLTSCRTLAISSPALGTSSADRKRTGSELSENFCQRGKMR